MIRLFKLFFKSFFTRKGHLLVVFQNNNELRAGGGFITAVLDISRFRFKFRRVFGELDAHEPVQGPKPLMEMLKDGHFKSWTFRDANYFPDFRESAEQMIYFYKQVFPREKVSGVLAVNFSFAESFLQKLGKLKFAGKSLAAHELFYFLSAEVSDIDRHSLDALAKRKNILMSLAKQLVAAALLRFWSWPALFNLVQKSFRSRDLQIYDAYYEREFCYERNQDFFAVIESNFLGLKSNRYISRNIFHDSIHDKKGKLSNEVRVVWEHNGSYDRPLSGVYRSYVRLYVPSSVTKLQVFSSQAVSDLTQTKEGNFLIIGFRMTLKPLEKLAINLSYLQATSDVEEYQFKFFKQSGVVRESFHKTVQFPRSSVVLPPREGVLTENLYTCSIGKVEADIELVLKTAPAMHAPRILKHEITSVDTIMLRFSEPVKIPLKQNFVLSEKDTRKSFVIEKVRANENCTELFLTVKKLPVKEEVFYDLRLKNIFSEEGQVIHPNPRHVTVVYRSRFFTR